MTLLLEVGRTGASKQSWRHGPRELLKSLMDNAKDPHAGKPLFKDFIAIVLPAEVRAAFENSDDERRLINIIEYWFTNNYNYLCALYPRPDDASRQAATKKTRMEKEETIRVAVREKIKEQAEVMLLDLVQPNGKMLRDCTGAEVRNLGAQMPSWFKAIAAKVKPDEIVGAVLSEDDVRNLAPEQW